MAILNARPETGASSEGARIEQELGAAARYAGMSAMRSLRTQAK